MHGVQKRRAIAKVAMWGIGPGPTLHWRTVVDDVRVYGSGHSTVLVEMGLVRVNEPSKVCHIYTPEYKYCCHRTPMRTVRYTFSTVLCIPNNKNYLRP